jgi:hypothetical protein
MDRINVYSYPDDEPRFLDGWFDRDAADRYSEATDWDGHNHISRATRSQWDHETLYRTTGGRWILNAWSRRQGSLETFEFVTAEDAKTWLLANEHDAAAAQHFGPIEEEKGPGRPEVGPAVNIRFPADLLAVVDEAASGQGITRAEYVRRAVAVVAGVA